MLQTWHDICLTCSAPEPIPQFRLVASFCLASVCDSKYFVGWGICFIDQFLSSRQITVDIVPESTTPVLTLQSSRLTFVSIGWIARPLHLRFHLCNRVRSFSFVLECLAMRKACSLHCLCCCFATVLSPFLLIVLLIAWNCIYALNLFHFFDLSGRRGHRERVFRCINF